MVIPAHNEEALLPACLRAVLTTTGPSLRVIVVANGCTDATVSAANAERALARERGHELVVVEIECAGKVRALNIGDTYCRGCSVVYLDADTVLLPGSLASVHAVLSAPGPRLTAPVPVLVRPLLRLTRAYAAIWSQLPGVANDVVGAGCYAANPAGRRRWGTFPDVVADDLFVRTRFDPTERVVAPEGGFLLVMPEGRDLVTVLRRWRWGNRQLAAGGQRSAVRRWQRGPRHFGMTGPRTWFHWPGFLLVSATVQLSLKGLPQARTPPWGRALRLREEVLADHDEKTLRVDVVVVTHESRAHIDGCLSSLRSHWAQLTVTVVDNSSRDGTPHVVSITHPEADLVRNETNTGFARAVNQAAAKGTGSYILLVNPDSSLDSGAIDELLALALRFPNAGLYGGRATDTSGRLHPQSCLARPSLRQSLAFGLGFSALPWPSRLNPDSLGGWKRDDIRTVPVLTGGLLLVDRVLWQRLDGFDERYVLYGEDADLSMRAAELGCRPMFTPRARYRHVGGASSSPGQRQILTLRGIVTLYNQYLPAWQAPIARGALLLGIGARSIAERALFSKRDACHRARTTAWTSRGTWINGWRAGDDLDSAVVEAV
ncbi:MAG: glycosyltransferase family 2 protein [Intrasporangium sp.]|uniref:glycosyltransferase family 2 protein n=1 Tax=Intrasporangium sp. TaxID=1925024 RepID=UPI0026486F2B|nr:glycosyltransferase family 2 protein [Intrasporangium sp.]MDN5797557.1 glycosyltransferase family 2 protein [Intrasporangium sp.]